MRHLKSGRKLGVDHSHRIALLRSLSLALIERDHIKTTPARAKELRWYADRLVSLAKKGDLHGRRQIVQILGSTENSDGKPNRVRLAVTRLYSELVPRFQTRPGGYTQIIRLARRRAGDASEMCLMRYLPSEEPKGDKSKKKPTGKKEAKSKDVKVEKKATAKDSVAPESEAKKAKIKKNPTKSESAKADKE